MNRTRWWSPSCFALAGAAWLGPVVEGAKASGFFNLEQDASAASVSDAGATAAAENAGTIFYNPAGLSFLGHNEFEIASGVGVHPIRFTNEGTKDPAGTLVAGDSSSDNHLFVLPSIFAAGSIADNFQVGMGVYVPFGQATRDDENWVGRYQVQQVKLTTVEASPTVAYRLTDRVSVAGSLDIQYARLQRSNALDFGSLCIVAIGGGFCHALGLAPQNADGHLAIDLNDWTVGYDIGLIAQLSEDLRVGVNYRSGTTHDFSGRATFEVPARAVPLTLGGTLFQDSSVRSKFAFPGMASVGVTYRINDRLTGLADFSWTHWSRTQGLGITFANSSQPPIVQKLDWHDTLRLALGASYKLTPDTDLRAGAAYDQAPIGDAFRSADLPDADALMLSAGVRHKLDDQIVLVVEYSYNHPFHAGLDLAEANSGIISGGVNQDVHVLGLEARLIF